jgi:putative ABC transport system substrate-binding protein
MRLWGIQDTTRRAVIAGVATAMLGPRRLGAQAQARDGARRLAVLTVPAANDPMWQHRAAILRQALAALGWREGDNLRVEWRSGAGDQKLIARYAEELVGLAPDVILAIGTPCVVEVRRRTSTIPTVFALVTDPVGQGFVASLSHPGGNITGFSDNELPMAGKWLSLLAQLTPPVKNVAVLYNPATMPFAERMLGAVAGAAPPLGIATQAAPVHDVAEIGAAIAAQSRQEGCGLLVLPDSYTIANRTAIVVAAASARLPAIYWNRAFVADGGLISYGTDNDDLLRRTATYVDRVLKGEKPGDLPVQNPVKFELVINLKVANALGLGIPASLLSTADEVIE